LNSIRIFNLADNLVKDSNAREPVTIAKDRKIDIYYSDKFKKLLGMYTCRWGQGIIIINDNLDVPTKRIVIAHEIGHNELHSELAKEDGLMEFSFLNITNITEYEANAFAAHLLLDNDDIDDIYNLLRQGYDIGTVSKILATDINLVMIKIKEMNKLGFNIPLNDEYNIRFLNKLSESL
jgi:Zn-dependent peptidase ImmA (M78 family)